MTIAEEEGEIETSMIEATVTADEAVVLLEVVPLVQATGRIVMNLRCRQESAAAHLPLKNENRLQILPTSCLLRRERGALHSGISSRHNMIMSRLNKPNFQVTQS